MHLVADVTVLGRITGPAVDETSPTPPWHRRRAPPWKPHRRAAYHILALDVKRAQVIGTIICALVFTIAIIKFNTTIHTSASLSAGRAVSGPFAHAGSGIHGARAPANFVHQPHGARLGVGLNPQAAPAGSVPRPSAPAAAKLTLHVS